MADYTAIKKLVKEQCNKCFIMGMLHCIDHPAVIAKISFASSFPWVISHPMLTNQAPIQGSQTKIPTHLDL